MNQFQNKTILITGASSGIGQASAICFAEQGANVAINYRGNKEGAIETAKQVDAAGGKSLLVKADVSDEAAILEMIDTTITHFGGIDVLVNNAAVQKETPSHLVSTKQFDYEIAVNLRGPFIASREIIAHFLKTQKKGVIVNISSAHELIPKPFFLPYSVSKSGMTNLTKTLALEYSTQGIRVNCIAPGATSTPMNEAWLNQEEGRKKVENYVPLGRIAEPREIAEVIVFVASPKASYITGQTIYVDGGATLFPEYKKNFTS